MSEFELSPLTTPDLNAALATAQGEFPPITRSKTVKTGSFSYSYAPLDAILDACRPVLSKHGLALTQLLESNGTGPAIRTELRHASGQTVSASFPLPTMPAKPQELGSLLTYLRRYAIVALLGIAAEEDDDGTSAQNAARPVGISAAGEASALQSASAPPAAGRMATKKQANLVWAIITRLDEAGIVARDRLREAMGAEYGTEDPAELTAAQIDDLITRLKAREEKAAAS